MGFGSFPLGVGADGYIEEVDILKILTKLNGNGKFAYNLKLLRSAGDYGFYVGTGTGHMTPSHNNAVDIGDSSHRVRAAFINSMGGALSMGGNQIAAVGELYFSPSELTISSGVVTATRSFHTVDTEGGISTDDLDTINGGNTGCLLVVKAVNTARTVVVKNGTGNIQLTKTGGDISLDNTEKAVILLYDGSNWLEL